MKECRFRKLDKCSFVSPIVSQIDLCLKNVVLFTQFNQFTGQAITQKFPFRNSIFYSIRRKEPIRLMTPARGHSSTNLINNLIQSNNLCMQINR